MLLAITRSCGYIKTKYIESCSPNKYNYKLLTQSNNTSIRTAPNSTIMLSSTSKIGLEPFCYKQFDRKNSANHIPMDKFIFLDKLCELIASGDCKFADGYAEFCKHIFVKNFTNSKLGILEITPENEHILKSDYLRRTEKELPVLTRWFPLHKVKHLIKEADYLDIILYSRDQIEKERRIMGETTDENVQNNVADVDFYIVSIVPLSDMNERPMVPITIMRNALIEEGGSGVPIDRNEYIKSVNFWSKHAIIIDM